VAYNPDGRSLASGSMDEMIKLWDVATGKELATLHGHAGGVISVAFSPDGKMLASASEDKTIKLWETQTTEFEKGSAATQRAEPITRPTTHSIVGEVRLYSVDLAKGTIKVLWSPPPALPGTTPISVPKDWVDTSKEQNIKVGAARKLEGSPHPVAILTLSVAPTTRIMINGKESQLATLQSIRSRLVDGVILVEWENELLQVGIGGGKFKLVLQPGGKAIGIEAKEYLLESEVHQTNLAKKTITIEFGDNAQVFKVAENVDVLIDGKTAAFSDLKPGMHVGLRLSPDGKGLVLGVMAFGPRVEGVVKTVNAERNTISILNPDITALGVPVAKDTKVVIDGTRARFSDLKAGMRITLQMSAETEQSLVIAITAGKVATK
jgi:WD40 repeat protein